MTRLELSRRRFLQSLGSAALAGCSDKFSLATVAGCPHWLLDQNTLAPDPPYRPSNGLAWFQDVAERSKFSYVTNNDYTGRKYFPQPMCGGVAVLDFDNDGRMDLFFTNGAKLPELNKTSSAYYNCLLRNNGDGTFDDVTEKAGMTGEGLGYCFGVAAADYDNDGYTDVFICNAGRNALYHNRGDGTFVDVTPGSGLDRKEKDLLSVGAAWFDYDGDGLLDLIVTNYTIWNPLADIACHSDTGAETYCNPTVVKRVAPALYRNLGNGKFQDVTKQAGLNNVLGKGMGISIADFTGSGRMDIFIANDTEPNFLFINQGDGTFKEEGLLYGVAYNNRGATVSGMGCDAKDFNNDGWVDITYNDIRGQIYGIAQNDNGRAFDDVARKTNIEKLSRPFSGWSMGFIDYDNDGWKDIYSANGDVDDLAQGSRQHDTMFRNQDGTTFADSSEQMGPDFLKLGYQRGSAFVDLNNDGFLDLVVTSLGQKPRILMNQGLNRNHWLMLDLRGRKSNRDGIGAKVKIVTPSGRALYNHVTTAVGFMSSSDKRVHFGLGSETFVASIEIRWPSGIRQTLREAKADQILVVEEADTDSPPPLNLKPKSGVPR